ncbi:MAG: esterase-like activity of phytase family protein [Pseudomonadota bacterium]|nr:esterase-like activity of phytase family protein [Pseudomonadota bacterium]
MTTPGPANREIERRNRPYRAWTAAVCAALSLLVITAFSWPIVLPGPERPEPVSLHPSTDSEGAATLLGALWLPRTTPDGSPFRGLSGLAWSGDDQLLYAISDFGWLYHLRPEFRDGRLVNLEFVSAMKLTDRQARPLSGQWADAEGLIALEKSAHGQHETRLVVSFERHPRIQEFDTQGLFKKDHPLPPPYNTASRYSERNYALEAVAFLPQHGLLSAPERPLRGAPAHATEIFFLNGQRFDYPLSPDKNCGLVAAEPQTENQLFIMERCYAGGRMVIALRQVEFLTENSATLEPRTLARWDTLDGWLLDNFEGLTRVGENTYLAISDDNGQDRQRTLLVYFRVNNPVAHRETP